MESLFVVALEKINYPFYKKHYYEINNVQNSTKEHKKKSNVQFLKKYLNSVHVVSALWEAMIYFFNVGHTV
jgi:hypothetical protein